MEEHLDGSVGAGPPRARTLAHMAPACLDVALAEWVAQEGRADLGDLFDTVFDHAATL